MFQVEYRTSDRVIVGVGPEADNTFPDGYVPGPGDALATLDDSQYMAVLMNDSAYLCADGATVQGAPC